MRRRRRAGPGKRGDSRRGERREERDARPVKVARDGVGDAELAGDPVGDQELDRRPGLAVDKVEADVCLEKARSNNRAEKQ